MIKTSATAEIELLKNDPTASNVEARIAKEQAYIDEMDKKLAIIWEKNRIWGE